MPTNTDWFRYNTSHKCNSLKPNKNEETSTITQEITYDDQEQSRPLTRRNINDYNGHKTGKPTPSPIIGSYTDITNSDQLDYRLSADCAWLLGRLSLA